MDHREDMYGNVIPDDQEGSPPEAEEEKRQQEEESKFRAQAWQVPRRRDG